MQSSLCKAGCSLPVSFMYTALYALWFSRCCIPPTAAYLQDSDDLMIACLCKTGPSLIVRADVPGEVVSLMQGWYLLLPDMAGEVVSPMQAGYL